MPLTEHQLKYYCLGCLEIPVMIVTINEEHLIGETTLNCTSKAQPTFTISI